MHRLLLTACVYSRPMILTMFINKNKNTIQLDISSDMLILTCFNALYYGLLNIRLDWQYRLQHESSTKNIEKKQIVNAKKSLVTSSHIQSSVLIQFHFFQII